MPAAFVTGGTGFVGWHVAKALAEEGWTVRALARGGPDRRSGLEDLPLEIRNQVARIEIAGERAAWKLPRVPFAREHVQAIFFERGEIGRDALLMAMSHVAHDCVLGDHVILSGFVGVHQFCRIGAHAFIGMGAFVNGDVPPYVLVAQEGYGRPRGINAEGLKRRGFDGERIAAIKRAYRALYLSGAKLDEARTQLAELARDSDDVRTLLEFIERGERPLLR